MAEPKFEESLNRLEKIVDDLENGGLNLDEAMKKYEEGMKLSGYCRKKLDEIKKKIEVLVKDPSGKFSTKDFDTDLPEPKGPSEESPSKQKGSSRKKRPKGEELLF